MFTAQENSIQQVVIMEEILQRVETNGLFFTFQVQNIEVNDKTLLNPHIMSHNLSNVEFIWSLDFTCGRG